MDKTLVALGLMSGTSMDGIDASLIRSDGEENIEIIGNLYNKYDLELKNSLFEFTNKIKSLEDLKVNLIEYKNLEREITIKHAEITSKLIKKNNIEPDIIGFHGQTILHNPKEKYSIQMGNAKLLSQLSKTNVVYQFRNKDLENGGEGAPLTPIYHHYLRKKINLKKPILFLNLGGIANYTFSKENHLSAKDVGPGNCLMDSYLKKTKNLDFDKNGNLASLGHIDISLINNILDHQFYNTVERHSLDIRDYDINFVKGLSVEDALANLNFFSAKTISENIKKNIDEDFIIILSGGGRKNKTTVSNLKKLIKNEILDIDNFNIDGDFVESQAFAFLSIRSLYQKNISFPNTTKVNKPTSGGKLIKYI